MMLLHLSSALGEFSRRQAVTDTPIRHPPWLRGFIEIWYDVFVCSQVSWFFLHGWLGFVGFNRLFEKKMSRHRKLDWRLYVQLPGCSVASFVCHFQRPNVWAVSSTERDLTQSWTDGFEQALGWACLNFPVNFMKKNAKNHTTSEN